MSPYTNEPNHQTSPHQQHHLYINTISTITPLHQQHTAFYNLHITDHHLQSEGHRIENYCPAQLHQIGADAIASSCGLECSFTQMCKLNKMARTFYCSFVPFLDLFFYFWVCSFVLSISILDLFYCTFYFLLVLFYLLYMHACMYLICIILSIK